MSSLCEEVEAQPALHATSPTAPLGSITPRYEGLYEPADLSLLVETHLTMLAGIDNACDIGNRNTSLSDVGS